MALGVVLIALLVALLIGAVVASEFKTGPIKAGLGATLTGAYIMAWGAMFLASYYFEDKSFFFRALIWICENASFPAGRGMAFFYAAIGLGFGGLMFLHGFGYL